MNFESRIAWRYLFSKKGHNAINIVSGVSAAAVAVVTAAMICVLSVMNGFGSLVEKMFSELDPCLLVVPAEGGTFRTDEAKIAALTAEEGIIVSGQLEQTALVRYKDHQTPVRVLGVDSLFTATASMDSIITDGFFSVWDGAFDRAVLGRGLAAQIGINAHFTGALHLYAPERTGSINMLRPDRSLHHEHAFIAGTFSVNQVAYDDQLMLVSLSLARRLFGYDDKTVSGLRIQTDAAHLKQQKQRIAQALGAQYRVLDRYEQQADFFRILKIEKWLTVLLLVFILLIASFNCIGSLSMLIIDKSDDIRTLSHLGASERTIRRIFRIEGWLISSLGALTGLVAGVLLCLGQQHFGWLKLGTGTEYIISAYPVEVQAADVVLVAIVVLVLGFAAAWYPTHKLRVRSAGGAMMAVLVVMMSIGFSSCTRYTPIPYRGMPAQYHSAWQEIYGPHYDSVPLSVVALDLYSDSLELDADHRMQGTGYNLYISDIFVSDSVLTPGEYHSLPAGGTAKPAPNTFLPGKDWEGTPSGIYMLYVEQCKLSSIQVFDSGQFVVKDTTNGLVDVQFALHYKNTYGYKATYKPHFQGILNPWRKH